MDDGVSNVRRGECQVRDVVHVEFISGRVRGQAAWRKAEGKEGVTNARARAARWATRLGMIRQRRSQMPGCGAC